MHITWAYGIYTWMPPKQIFFSSSQKRQRVKFVNAFWNNFDIKHAWILHKKTPLRLKRSWKYWHICMWDKVREGVNWKKTFSFGHCPNYLNPPPWPQFGQLGPLFSEVKIQDLKVSLELRILYVLYDILYICNLKNS